MKPEWSIHKGLVSKQQRTESADAHPFFKHLSEWIMLDDVSYPKNDPPDFLLHRDSDILGMELTRLVPVINPNQGYHKIRDFKRFSRARKQGQFEWGEYTVGFLLACFSSQLQIKTKGINRWTEYTDQRWLVFFIESGSPFGSLAAKRLELNPDNSALRKDIQEHNDFLMYNLHSICRTIPGFDYVFLSASNGLKVFSTNTENPYKLPVPDRPTLTRGQKVPSSHFEWESSLTTTKKLV